MLGRRPADEGGERGGKGDTAPPAGDGVRGGGAWPGTGTGEDARPRCPSPTFFSSPPQCRTETLSAGQRIDCESHPAPRAVFLSGIITEEMIVLSAVLCLSLNL